jgi:hypothetical protein
LVIKIFGDEIFLMNQELGTLISSYLYQIIPLLDLAHNLQFAWNLALVRSRVISLVKSNKKAKSFKSAVKNGKDKGSEGQMSLF